MHINAYNIVMTRASQLTAKPTANLALHLAFEQRLQNTVGQRFVFTDKYVTHVLNNIIMKQSPIMQTHHQHPPNLPMFVRIDASL